MDRGSKPPAERQSQIVDVARFLELAEQMERANNTIEILVNRTNTLVRLLDLLNQRVDRIETSQRATVKD